MLTFDQALGKAGFDPNEPRDQSGKALSFEQALIKAYPEFVIDQPRDPKTGRWSGGGGTALRPGHEARDLLQRNLNARKTPTRSEFEASLTPEQQQFLKDRREQLSRETPTDRLFRHSGAWDPERAALHERLIQQRLDDAMGRAQPAPGEAPRLVVMGGRPGSGKTTSLMESGFVPDMNNYLYISADDLRGDNKKFKAGDERYGLPGYEGWNSSLFHTEASEMMDELEKRARDLGLNIIHDATMRSVSASEKLIHDFEDAGYDISGLFVHASPENAALRAITRGMEPGGRFVPTYVLGTHVNEAAFDAVKYRMSNWKLYDANSRTARLVASGNKDRVTYSKAGFDPNEPRDQEGKWTSSATGYSVPENEPFRVTGRWPREDAPQVFHLDREGSIEERRPPSDKVKRDLGFYTGSGYTGINYYLRNGWNLPVKLPGWHGTVNEPINDYMRRMFQDFTSIDDVLNGLDEYTRSSVVVDPFHVYRAMGKAALDNVMAGLSPGDVIQDKGFMSTTAHGEVLDDFGGGYMRIELPSGSRIGAVFMDDATHTHEGEVLLPRGSRLEFLGHYGDYHDFRLMRDLGKAGFDPNEPRDEQGRWTSGGLDMRDLERAKQEAKKGWPGASVLSDQETRYSTLTVKNANVDFAVTYHPKENIVTVPFIEAHQGSGGRDAISAMVFLKKVAQDTGAKAINLLASDESGGFVWPRLGFDLADIWAVRRLTDQVATRLSKGEDEGWFTSDQLTEAHSILSAGGVGMGTKLAHLNSPVPLAAVKALTTGTRAYDKPTFGKVLLMGTSTYYSLPRARFGALGRFGKVAEDWGFYIKAGFDPNEPRDEQGRWTGGSSLDMSKDVKKIGKRSSRGWEAYPGSNMSFDINSYLRGMSKPSSPFWRKRFDRIIRSLDEFITAHETTAPGLVFRGVASKHALLDSLKPGDIVADKAFISTTTNRDMAVYLTAQIEGSSKVLATDIMEVHVPKGVHVGPVDLYLPAHGESEIILPRSSHLRFEGRAVDDNGHRVFRFTLLR